MGKRLEVRRNQDSRLPLTLLVLGLIKNEIVLGPNKS